MTAKINQDRRLIYLSVNSMLGYPELIHTIKCRLAIDLNQLLLLKAGDSVIGLTLYTISKISNANFPEPPDKAADSNCISITYLIALTKMAQPLVPGK